MNRAERSTFKNGNSRPAEKPDPLRFGWRYQWRSGPDGSQVSVQVPLSLDDLLHPRRGDVTPQNTQHERDCRYLFDVLTWRLADNPHALVLSDCLVDWGARGLGNHTPDISVFDDIRDPERDRWILSVTKEKARSILVMEVVSPDAHEAQARDNDVAIKVREYYRARVPLYVIVDQEREGGPRQIVGYRRRTRKYVSLPLDEHGRLLLEPVRLLMGLREERVICWDAETGDEILDFVQMAQALADTRARIRELESRARSGGRESAR